MRLLPSLFTRRRREQELRKEFEFHFENLVSEKQGEGMSEAEARSAARREFGSAELWKDQCRDQRGTVWMEDLLRDAAFAVRLWRKSPGFAITAIATLALGLGAAVMMFAVLYAVVLRPLPYRDPERLVILWIDDAKRGIHEEGASYPTYVDWRAQAKSFEELAARTRGHSVRLAGPEPERMEADIVSAPFFQVLGVAPEAGRVFTSEEEQRGELAAVISKRLAMRRFGSAQAAVGQSLELDGRLWHVVGVMPPRYGLAPYRQDLWLPAQRYPGLEKYMTERSQDFFMGVGRLKAGATPQEAEAEMNTIGAALAKSYPIADPDFGGYGARVVSIAQQVLGIGLPRALQLLMGAVSLVLLVACLNIASLLLARGEKRREEMAVRTALGAGAGRLMKQQLTEAMILSMVGAALGIAFAAFGLRVLPSFAPAGLPRFDELSVGVPVLLFAAAATACACAAFAVVPAWLQNRSAPALALAAAGSRLTSAGASRLQSAFIVAEFAASVVLLIGAGLFFRSLWAVESNDAGYQTRHMLLMEVSTKQRGDMLAYYRDLFDRLRAIPGVESAGAIGSFFYDRNADYTVTVQGREPEAHEQVTVDGVTPAFLETVRARLIDGRFLDESDYRNSRPSTVVINETFARRFFPGQRAVGQHFKFGTAQARGPWIEVVGVVADLKRHGLERNAVCEAFGPLPGGYMNVLVRTSNGNAAAMRRAIREADATALISGETTVEAKLNEFGAARRMQTWLLSAFSLITLFLSAVGVFGVMQYITSSRRRELAIRTALGATGNSLRRSVLRDGMRHSLTGMALGCLVAVAMGRVVESMLYGVRPLDPLAFAAAMVLLAAAALLACWIPAASAARANPATLLRD